MADEKNVQVAPKFPAGVNSENEFAVVKFLYGKPATLQSELEKHTTNDCSGGFMPFGEIRNLITRKVIARGDATKATLILSEQGVKAYDDWKSKQPAAKARASATGAA